MWVAAWASLSMASNTFGGSNFTGITSSWICGVVLLRGAIDFGNTAKNYVHYKYEVKEIIRRLSLR